jgi:uncharacterized protein (DUF58 family)
MSIFSPDSKLSGVESTALSPRTRLIASFALLVTPIAALAPIWPNALFWAAAAGATVFILAAVDALFSERELRDIHIETPAVARLQKHRTGSFEISFRQDRNTARVLRVGCLLPPTITTPEEVRIVELPARADRASITWSCTPSTRGLFLLSAVAIEAVSPLGLWARRERREVRTELRVYPDLLAERQRVAALFLRRGMAGSHARRRAGQGREFEKLRDYVAGDSLGDVHWRASAKRRHLVTKVHQIERSHEVYVVIDASRLSAREVTRESEGRISQSAAGVHLTALDRYVSAALILGAAAERQGDQFGLITFSDRILTFLRARAGQGHYDSCREQLYTLQPQGVTPDFDELCGFIRTRLNKRALLVFLTALDDPYLAESFVDSSQLIAKQHLILVNMLRPRGVRPVFENSSVTELDDLYRELGGHLQWERLRELEGVLRRQGMRFSLLDAAGISADLVKQHGDIRARELI